MNSPKLSSSLAQTSPWPMGLNIVGAEGCYLIGHDGKRYLDLVAGLAVNNTGHQHPEIVAAIHAQTDRFLHVMPYGEFIQDPQQQFAASLTEQLPQGLDSVYFVNSGTEAVEAALKLAKRISNRTQLIGAKNSYHGSTHGSLSVSDNEVKKYRNRPLLPDTTTIPFNDPSGLSQITERTAAVIIETVQGDAGVRIPSKAWMQELRAKTTEVGALLILDEIQTGFGRTGSLFAFEQFGIVPDILVLGKALGGGMPMGAFISSTAHMNLLTTNPVLGHITTFGGHPLACVAGESALKIIVQNQLPERAQEIGKLFRKALQHPKIVELRGIGAMMAVELENAAHVQQVVEGCLANGVLGFWFLSCPKAFRIAPPLTITDEEITVACETIKNELDKL